MLEVSYFLQCPPAYWACVPDPFAFMVFLGKFWKALFYQDILSQSQKLSA